MQVRETATAESFWRRVSIAPMMEITDRRFRFFLRLLNRDVRLYTEMIVAHAILRGDRERLLKFDASEHPVVLQLGGSDPALMAEAARIGESFGYDAVDVNCGCPSDRVGSGNFGACLMRQPELVAGVVSAIHNAVKIPVSVKCRIGITGEESEEALSAFAGLVFDAGASWLTVHARTASLNGLSPKDNRTIPPLRYEWVYRLKEKFPNRVIEINGGIRTRQEIEQHLGKVDRVMLGRLAHDDPYFFSQAEGGGVGERLAILEAMAEYAARHEASDISASRFFGNMLNLFHGLPGARLIRRFLSEEGRKLSPAEACLRLREMQQLHAAPH